MSKMFVFLILTLSLMACRDASDVAADSQGSDWTLVAKELPRKACRERQSIRYIDKLERVYYVRDRF